MRPAELKVLQSLAQGTEYNRHTYNNPEYKGSDKGFDIVQHDYNSIDFWNNYDGTKSPLNGAAATGPVYWVA